MTVPECRPDRPLPLVHASTDTQCSVCETRLVRQWNAAGVDYSWVDENGCRAGGTSPIPEVVTPGEYLTYLQRQGRMGEYSNFAARWALGSGLLPWEHWHASIHKPSPVAPGEVPACCSMPMQMVRDGWRCRVRHTIFSVTTSAAM